MKFKLNSRKMDDIKELQSICGRSLSYCKKLIENTKNSIEALIEVNKSGVPCIAFNKKEDEDNFLKSYPNLIEMISRLTGKAINVCEDVYFKTGNKIYETICKLIPQSVIAEEISDYLGKGEKLTYKNYKFWDVVEALDWESVYKEKGGFNVNNY